MDNDTNAPNTDAGQVNNTEGSGGASRPGPADTQAQGAGQGENYLLAGLATNRGNDGNEVVSNSVDRS